MSKPVTREVRALAVLCKVGEVHYSTRWESVPLISFEEDGESDAVSDATFLDLNPHIHACGPHSVVLLRGEVAGKAKRGSR
jgi:hypothetical protein